MIDRIHHRDWTIEACYPDLMDITSLGSQPLVHYSRSPEFSLSMRMSTHDVQRLMNAYSAGTREPSRFSSVGFSVGLGDSVLVSGIAITGDEARQITEGADPLDVLFPVWPGLGYRLVAVPDWLPERGEPAPAVLPALALPGTRAPRFTREERRHALPWPVMQPDRAPPRSFRRPLSGTVQKY